ncbi:hemin uptake protein HemP [Rhodoferax sp. U11-2br]|uniref:hemin uptake protein HemP n=1 Tax=Rhodoferax sp. U11-2br TaxID=2838878 RepID=UPI001BEAA91E|nr:hemin uptake protein HemP [Rhodoferax sp. U11-2br]MBT3066195.1 hemin uptake protein HemP [Rhodoferax sp. U11-2br]
MAQQSAHDTQAGVAAQPLGAQSANLRGLGSPAPVSSAAVLRGFRSVPIEHEGVIYRLQVTKLGKLILTK